MPLHTDYAIAQLQLGLAGFLVDHNLRTALEPGSYLSVSHVPIIKG